MTYQTQNGFVLTPKEVARLKRRAEILSEAKAMREDGATLAAIGERYGFTKQRAHQMLLDAGIITQRRSA